MENNHPHVAGKYILVHNGVIAVKPAGIKLESECDSEILVRVIERAGGVQPAYKEIMELEGSLAILCWDGESLWFLRNTGSPGYYVEHGNGIFAASTAEIIMDAAKRVGLEIGEPKRFKAGSLYHFYLQ
jgi:glucosamine 6-phosphate synthetase-like amidotransferase/phosphosugar isomerase protein